MNDKIFGNKLLLIVLSAFTDNSILSLNDILIFVTFQLENKADLTNLKRRIRDKLNCLVSIDKLEKIEFKNDKNIIYYKYKLKN